ncbi:MAG: UDP-N-acetylglucosamine 2-epimerase [Gemmatales bacterium]|nr:UDP-N-acetylglucosamine 2-epimerase [Gemmatales bacterium]MDW7995510.1 UDP-N-acetylglucosamine 2-epimerase [Gemmatales bacterium]
MRKIFIVTVARSDWGIYLPVIRRLREVPGVSLYILAGGMHHVREYGYTIEEVRQEAKDRLIELEFLLASDSPIGIAKSLSLGVLSFAPVFREHHPDILVVLGDRYEMLAAALAALPFQIPIAHIHGGELSLGAMDDSIRHSITKFSHLHFVATREYARRVMQLGEEPWRVLISGAPALDNIVHFHPMPRTEFFRTIGLPDEGPYLLVTYHPVTREYLDTEFHIRELLKALDILDLPVLFTSPNADTHGRVIHEHIQKYCQTHRNARFLPHCGVNLYYNAMYYAAAMLGNSSSGIIEAPSFRLPVVNVGTRQAGRLRAANVIDTGYGHSEILAAVSKVLQPSFRESLRNLQNPYGDGHASERIALTLSTIPLDRQLVKKRFFDLCQLMTSISRSSVLTVSPAEQLVRET